MPAKVNTENKIMACLLTGVYDVNRNTTLLNDDYTLVKKWADSIIALNLQGVIFHNNFSEETCKKQECENIKFVKVYHNPAYNPNVYRYYIYSKFLAENKVTIKNVFCTLLSNF